MKPIVYSVTLAGLFLAAGCVRRTVTDRPGWRDPTTGELRVITPTYEKTVENRVVWIWEDEFWTTKDQFDKADATDLSTE